MDRFNSAHESQCLALNYTKTKIKYKKRFKGSSARESSVFLHPYSDNYYCLLRRLGKYEKINFADSIWDKSMIQIVKYSLLIDTCRNVNQGFYDMF